MTQDMLASRKPMFKDQIVSIQCCVILMTLVMIVIYQKAYLVIIINVLCHRSIFVIFVSGDLGLNSGLGKF